MCIAPGLIRCDITDDSPNALNARQSVIMNVRSAKQLAIILVNAIEQAEVAEARANNRKGKRK